MELGFEFEHPWALLFLAALPLYAWLRGRVGRTAALLFPDAALLAGLSRRVREGAGGLRLVADRRQPSSAARASPRVPGWRPGSWPPGPTGRCG